MGRRALRKVDPRIDLSRYLLTVEQLPAACSGPALFDRDAPLEIEVGSGKGLFLAGAAAARPEACFLGVEIAAAYARYAAARLARAGLANAKVVHGDALRAIGEHVAAGALAAVHVYFPDPWWKARHKKRRVMNAAFVRDIERALCGGGRLHFWTDVEEYFQTTLALLAAETGLRGPLPVAEQPAEHDLDYRTHFERRMRLHGQAVYRSEFEKR